DASRAHGGRGGRGPSENVGPAQRKLPGDSRMSGKVNGELRKARDSLGFVLRQIDEAASTLEQLGKVEAQIDTELAQTVMAGARPISLEPERFELQITLERRRAQVRTDVGLCSAELNQLGEKLNEAMQNAAAPFKLALQPELDLQSRVL